MRIRTTIVSRRRQRRYVTDLLVACCLVCVSQLSILTTYAQQGLDSQAAQISQRELQLPDGGSPNIHRQMQMLRRLKSDYEGNRSAKPAPKLPELTPEQIVAMKQAMEMFGGQLPDGLMDQVKQQLKNFTPEDLSALADNPETKQQVQKMLEQYSRDKKMPFGDSSSSGTSLPLAQESRTPNSRSASPDNKGQNRFRQKRSGSNLPSPPANQSQTTKPSVDELLKKMRAAQNKAQPGADQAPRRRQRGITKRTDERRPDRSLQRSGRPNENTFSGGEFSERDMTDLLDGLIEKQRKADGRPPGSSGSRGNSGSNGSGFQSELAAELQGMLKEGLNNSHFDDSSVTNITDFLKEFKDVPFEQFSAQNESGKQAGSMSNNQPGVAAANRNVEAKEAAERQGRQQREKVKADLKKNGFQRTLMKIAQETAKQVRIESKSEGGESSSGFEKELFKVVKGLRKDLVDILKDAERSPRTQGANSTRMNSQSATAPTSTLGQMAKSTTDFLADMATPIAEGSSTVASASNRGLSNGVNLWPALFFIFVLVIGAATAHKLGLIRPFDSSTVMGPPVDAEGIASKEDVIRAFHQMAMKPERQTQAWWTHQRVVTELVEKTPENSEPAESFAAIYEQARYLPSDVDLSDDQIATAAEAFRRCQL